MTTFVVALASLSFFGSVNGEYATFLDSYIIHRSLTQLATWRRHCFQRI